MIVVDVNVIAYLYIEGVRTAEAEAVRRADATWAAPRLWRSELRSVLALYLRRAVLALEDALRIAQDAERLMHGHEIDVASRDVLELVGASRLSAYDCEYVALARELGVPLVTADAQVLAAFPSVAVAPAAFGATR
jgi:predicted nucleic acid-binding protein